jgi:hypothetical protein
MALLYPRATLQPTKLELLASWLPTRSWYRGPAEPNLTRVAGYRFDDPDGEVGIETLLVGAETGPVHQVPLTYRAAPLDGADAWLVGTMEHSVLGRRWVYDACGDPVYAAALAVTILTGGAGAEEFNHVDGGQERRELTMTVSGSATNGAAAAVGAAAVGAIVRVEDGDPTLIVTGSVELAVRRVLDDPDAEPTGGGVLTGIWGDRSTPYRLATVRA